MRLEGPSSLDRVLPGTAWEVRLRLARGLTAP